MALKDVKNLSKSNKRPLSIWFVHDSKPGHVHQLQGLEERIAHYCDINTSWINTNENKLSWFDILLKNKIDIRTSDTTSPDTFPDIVIGAGHTTHKALLFSARIHNAYCIVLMKPSLPLCFFDAVICPEHDKLKESKRVLNTYGALNTVSPASKVTSKTLSLMLIGGPSKHFNWQENNLLKQIQIICKQNNKIKWLLSDSPRTPSSLLPKLEQMNIQNLSCFHYQDNNLESLHTLMQKSVTTWATPDSVSMVYESLTAGTPTYVFTMSPRKTKDPSRVARSINNLINKKYVISFQDWKLHTDMKPNKLELWEADRAAKWLLKQYFEKHPYKNDL